MTTAKSLRAAMGAMVLGAMAAGSLSVQAQTPAPAAAARTPVTRADQLPRRVYELPRLPSELLEGPLSDLMPVVAALERDILADLAAFDIQDAATLRSLYGARLSMALLRGELADAKALAVQIRALQDKPGPKATSGLLAELVLQARAEGGDEAAQVAWLRKNVAERFAALPWADAQDSIKGLKGQLEIASRALVVGTFRAQLDPAAKNAGMKLDAGTVATIIGARAQLDRVLPVRDALVAGLGSVVDKQVAAAPAKPDRWSERLVTLAPTDAARSVVVGIWDSGVDLTLFKPAPGRGMAFTAEGLPSTDLLRPLGEAQPRWPQLRGQVKGALDLRAALDTEESRKLKQTIAQLKPEQAQAFQEDLGLASLYVHGTHVAGIATAGNPFASVYAVTMLWDHRVVPTKPTEEISRRVVANYARTVAGFKAAGVRVVNMSWRYGPTFYEGALAFHGVGKDGEERKKMAQALFAAERDALKAAIASAPEILFVAGAGNEDNSADFVEYIPAGLELPNLVTAGAVDQAGEETSFSTFGKTVVLHANGFEVDSVVPGGDHLKLSGTSMAAPQVTNLAAKLLALNPKLTVAQLRELIFKGAERKGRVNLINPKASVALLKAGAA